MKIFGAKPPEWVQQSDGRWKRVWDITLEEPLTPQGGNELAALSDEYVIVDAVIHEDRRTVTLATLTTLDPFGDEMFLLWPYRMLRKIDASIGRIESVQGYPRNRWVPFMVT